MRAAGAAAAALGLLLLAGCAPPPVGHAELELVGTWAGQGDAVGDGVLEMIVTGAESDGSAFEGELTFALGGQRATEPVAAHLTPNGHLAGTVGALASIELHIVDPRTLDYCFASYGRGHALACSRLVRAS